MTTAWYAYPRIDNYAIFPDPYGAFPKPDSNINAPAGTPITALGSGIVSGINAPDGSNPAFGQVVTIKLDQPLNPIATHMAYLHLNGLPAGLAIGQRVSVGDTIGYAGANAQGNAGTGFALYNGDFYGYGPTWAQYVGSAFLNPVPFLNKVVASGGSVATSQLAGGTVGYTSLTGDATSSILDPYIGPIEANVSAALGASMFLIIGLVALLGGLFILVANTPLGQNIKAGATKTAELAVMA